jgi:hypothetical protein
MSDLAIWKSAMQAGNPLIGYLRSENKSGLPELLRLARLMIAFEGPSPGSGAPVGRPPCIGRARINREARLGHFLQQCHAPEGAGQASSFAGVSGKRHELMSQRGR